MEVDEIIGVLRDRWRNAGWTLGQIGARMGGNPPQNVALWLNGKKQTKLSTLIRLADALDYEVVLRDRRAGRNDQD